jgi:hypothetical protein
LKQEGTAEFEDCLEQELVLPECFAQEEALSVQHILALLMLEQVKAVRVESLLVRVSQFPVW